MRSAKIKPFRSAGSIRHESINGRGMALESRRTTPSITQLATGCSFWTPTNASVPNCVRRSSVSYRLTLLTGQQRTTCHEGTTIMASGFVGQDRSEEHTSELQSLTNLVCRLLLEK